MKVQEVDQQYEFEHRPPTNAELVRAALMKMGGWAGVNQIAKESGLSTSQVVYGLGRLPVKRVQASVILLDVETTCPVCETPLPIATPSIGHRLLRRFRKEKLAAGQRPPNNAGEGH